LSSRNTHLVHQIGKVLVLHMVPGVNPPPPETHHRTTPLWPQDYGEAERQNRSMIKRVRIAQVEVCDRRSELDKFLMYRSTAHTVTWVSSSELLFGR
jgi:hypothetical protein